MSDKDFKGFINQYFFDIDDEINQIINNPNINQSDKLHQIKDHINTMMQYLDVMYDTSKTNTYKNKLIGG